LLLCSYFVFGHLHFLALHMCEQRLNVALALLIEKSALQLPISDESCPLQSLSSLPRSFLETDYLPLLISFDKLFPELSASARAAPGPVGEDGAPVNADEYTVEYMSALVDGLRSPHLWERVTERGGKGLRRDISGAIPVIIRVHGILWSPVLSSSDDSVGVVVMFLVGRGAVSRPPEGLLVYISWMSTSSPCVTLAVL